MADTPDITPIGVPDYHGDAWIYTERGADGQFKANAAKHVRERGRDGFSEYDWWNFDTFIAEIVARAALRFAREGHCYFEDMGEKGTAEYYLGIAGALMDYAEHEADGTPQEQAARVVAARAAMMRFAEHFTGWND